MINVNRTRRHHFRSFLLVVLMALLALRFPSARAATPAGCHLSGAVLTCPLKIGFSEFTLDGTTATALALVNTGRSLQLNQVIGQSRSGITGTFGEFCVYLDQFKTAQSSPGVGEVGCFPKKASERYFGALEWGTSTALAVPAGSTLYMQGYVQPVPGKGHDFPFQFNVTTYPQSRGVLSYRQPKVDAAIYCNRKPAVTAGSPWPNDTGRTLTILGATIYALDPPPDAACLYILAAGSGAVKWKNCKLTPNNQRGVAMLPAPVTVQPGEQILAQASHTCAAPGVWDWAAYIYTY